MNVKIQMNKMEFLLSLAERDLSWAKKLCVCSRLIHIDVWRTCEDREYVKKQVIPRLRDAVKEINEQGEKEGKKVEFQVYSKNIEARADNLGDNYIKSKPSAFVPDDKISEKKSAIA